MHHARTGRMTADQDPSPQLVARRGAEVAPKHPLDARCLWATCLGRRDVVIVGPHPFCAGEPLHPTWEEIDEIAEACWDAAVVLAFGSGVLVLAASGYATGRAVACSSDEAAHVQRLAACPTAEQVCFSGRLVTARTWDDLVGTRELDRLFGSGGLGSGPWLQRLRHPARLPSRPEVDLTLDAWVRAATCRFWPRGEP